MSDLTPLDRCRNCGKGERLGTFLKCWATGRMLKFDVPVHCVQYESKDLFRDSTLEDFYMGDVSRGTVVK